MEKRTLLAFALSAAVMVIWSVFFAPQPPPPRQSAPAEQAARTPESAAAPQAQAAQAIDTGQLPAPAAAVQAPAVVGAAAVEEFRVTTATQDIRFTNEGGRIRWWKLLKYSNHEGVAQDLIPEEAAASGELPFQVVLPADAEGTRRLATALHAHELVEIPPGDPSGLGPGTRVEMSWADGKGLAVRKSMVIPSDGYVSQISFEVTRDGKPIEATLLTATGLAQKIEGDTQSYGHVEGQGVLHDGREIIRMAPASLAGPVLYSAARGTPVRWAGLESTYFASLVLPDGGAPGSDLAISWEPRRAAAGAAPAAPIIASGVTAPGGTWRLFVGPKDYKLLVGLGHEMERVIDFSRFSLIYLVTKYLFLALTWIHGSIGNYGWSIIVMTVLLRLVFFPLTYKSAITMRQTSKKMAKIQPRVKAIQERYKKLGRKTMDQQRQMNEEVMALYKKEGVNPMANLGGCLPLLLQMPIFIGFYNLLAVTIELRQAPFILWLGDLSQRDPYYITPILMGISWLVQQWMTSASIPDPMQRRMMMFMPVMFTFFMMNMPSGLVIYWLTNNILGLVQQWLTNRKADQLDEAARALAA